MRPLLALLGIVAAAWWLLHRLPRRDKKIAALIRPPIQKFTGTDDALRLRTEARRQAASGIRSRAVRVESGSSVGEVLRMVKR